MRTSVLYTLLYPWYVIIITYNMQPYFPLKNLGKKCALNLKKYNAVNAKKESDLRSLPNLEYNVFLLWKTELSSTTPPILIYSTREVCCPTEKVEDSVFSTYCQLACLEQDAGGTSLWPHPLHGIW